MTNTVSYAHKQLTVLKAVVESETEIKLNWFDNNKMQADPEKLQAIEGGKIPFLNSRVSVSLITLYCVRRQ